MSTKFSHILPPVGLLIALITTVFFSWTHWDVSFISHDGIQYLSTVGNLLEDRGLSTGTLLYNSHYQSVLPAPQTVWPPGYPLLIALLSITGLEPQRAALLIALTAHAGSALCITVIVVRSGFSCALATLVAAGFMCLVLPWNYATQLLADPLMSFLILAILATLPGAGNEARHTNKNGRWLTCGILCACLLLTRYSAILFFAATVLVLLHAFLFLPFNLDRQAENKVLLKRLSPPAILCAVPLAVFAALMFRNFRLTGSFLPNNGNKQPLSLAQTAKQFSDAITGFLGIDNTVLPDMLNAALSVVVVLVILTVVLYSLFLLKGHRLKTHRADCDPVDTSTYRNTVSSIVLIHTILFTAYFVHKSLSPGFPVLLPRYIFQIAGGLYVVFGMLAANAWQKSHHGHSPGGTNWLPGLLVMLFVLVQIGQVNTWFQFNRYAPRHQMITEVLTSNVTTNLTFNAFLEECYRDDPLQNSLWSNEGQLLHFYTGITTLSLPDKYRFLPEYNRDTIEEHIDKYQVRILALLESEYRTDNIHSLDTLRNWFDDMGLRKLSIDTSGVTSPVRAEVYVADPKCG